MIESGSLRQYVNVVKYNDLGRITFANTPLRSSFGVGTLNLLVL